MNQIAEIKAKYLTILMSIPKEWHRSMLFYTIKVSIEVIFTVDIQSFIETVTSDALSCVLAALYSNSSLFFSAATAVL